MHIGLHVKHPLFLLYFNKAWGFSTDFSKNIEISDFMKIGPVGADIFSCVRTVEHTGRQTERRTDMTNIIVAKEKTVVMTNQYGRILVLSQFI
jgi:hypothetical protein